MGFSIKNIFKLFGPKKEEQTGTTVACIANKYFLFEESRFPQSSLKPNEISDMAKIAIEGMVPGGTTEMASGFFVNKNKSSVTVFIASKSRLLEEIPQLASCQYWLPEKFVSEYISSELAVPQEKNYTAIVLDSKGCCSVNGRNISLFSEEFWTAELHGEEANAANRKFEMANSTFSKGTVPLVYAVIMLSLFVFALYASQIGIRIWNKTLQSGRNEMNRIMERERLRDEALGFSAEKLSYLRHLEKISSLRPKEMKFVEFRTSGAKITHIVGKCASVSALNKFLGELQKERSIGAISTGNVVSKQNATTFNLKVEFL
ncbi:MAG: hypothetical protein LBI56_00795 [Puniceicoccales bacterium]|jgi:hypothetical protein|nr:hypothetical protein [Puniceicoccales bacterium]